MYHAGDGAGVYDIELDAADMSEGIAFAGPSLAFPDKELLFTADFRRLGADLLLVGPDNSAVIYDYFKGEIRASLVTPHGAELSGRVVEILAGPGQPGKYAQAAVAAVSQAPIGRIEKVSGSATVLRNGVPVELHLGDLVAKGDVVQTGSDSSLTIKFSDGTVFGLSSSARIVLNDMVYAAESRANSALFTLVQGVVGFVAGRIAKTGDFKVETPVATMAIRGTAIQTEISAQSGTTRFSLLAEPDGTVGSFLLLDRNNPSRVIASISDARMATVLTPVAFADIRITQVQKTANDLQSENEWVRDAFQIFSPEPRQRRGSSDFDGSPIVPAGFFPDLDGPDQRQFTVTPFASEAALFRSALMLPIAPAPITIRGIAREDDPLVALDAATAARGQLPGAVVLTVNVPASLPPGVAYREDRQAFTLDPSHPAYQHLARGESATVMVNYSLSGAGTKIPATVSWTITGRNDAPVARNDRFAGIAESGQSVIAARANDSDIDGDSVHILRWTSPIEGTVSLGRNGDLIFNPGQDFRTLSTGETATVSFTYTISDGNGGTDTATATVQVRGTGTFSSPRTSVEASGILAFNHQSVTLTLGAPAQTTKATADLSLAVGLGPVPQPQMNILYAVDISGSTSEAFSGTAVGDPNNDGISNTILDAEIGGLIRLTERVRELGFSPADVTVTVIPFNGSANPAESGSPGQNDGNTAMATFSLGQSGDETIANFLRSLGAGGRTNFEDALQAAIEALQGLDQGGETNLVYFMSDGNGTGSIEDELATLDTIHHAQITAVGIGANANLSLLEAIDNTGGAELVTSTDQLNASLLGFPMPGGTIVDVDVLVNGKELLGIEPEDLVMTSGGMMLDLPITGLGRQVGNQNTVSASITFASGETLATTLVIAGALPRSADFIL